MSDKTLVICPHCKGVNSIAHSDVEKVDIICEFCNKKFSKEFTERERFVQRKVNTGMLLGKAEGLKARYPNEFKGSEK